MHSVLHTELTVSPDFNHNSSESKPKHQFEPSCTDKLIPGVTSCSPVSVLLSGNDRLGIQEASVCVCVCAVERMDLENNLILWNG